MTFLQTRSRLKRSSIELNNKNGFFRKGCKSCQYTSTMKYTSYTVRITTPSGKDYDEYSKFNRDDYKFRLSLSNSMFNSYAEVDQGMTVREIVKRDVCNHVKMAHTEEQRKHIVSVVFDMHCGLGYMYVEWSNGNPEVITIPTQKYTTTYVDKTTGAKKRRKFHFHYEHRVIKRGALFWANLYRLTNDEREEIDDDDSEIFEEDHGAEGWIYMSDRIREHADAYLKTFPYKYNLQAEFGGDGGSGLIDFYIENEDTIDIKFPPLKVTYKDVQYEFVFRVVEWSPLVEED